MKTLNKNFALLLALLMSFALVACGTTKPASGVQTDPSASTDDDGAKKTLKKQKGGNMERAEQDE